MPRRRFLVWIFLGSLAIRCAFLIGNQEGSDLYEHGDIAHNLVSGHGFTMHWPYPTLDKARQIEVKNPPKYKGSFVTPFNPYLLAGFYVMFGENKTALVLYGILLSILSALVPIVIYYLTNYFASERTARFAALLAALNLFAAYAVSTFSGSTLYQLFAPLGICCLLAAIKRKTLLSYCIVGLLSGILMFLRSEYFLMGPLMIVAAGLFSQNRFKERVRFVVVALAAHTVIVFPWVYRNYQLFDKFVPVLSHPWYEVWRGNNRMANGTGLIDEGHSIWVDTQYHRNIVVMMDAIPYDQHFEIAADSIFKEQVIAFWQHDPVHALTLGLTKVAYFISSDFKRSPAVDIFYGLASFALFITAVFGIVSLFKKGETQYSRVAGVLFSLFLVYYLALTFFTVMQPRYQIYVLNTLLPMSAAGIMLMAAYVKARSHSSDTEVLSTESA